MASNARITELDGYTVTTYRPDRRGYELESFIEIPGTRIKDENGTETHAAARVLTAHLPGRGLAMRRAHIVEHVNDEHSSYRTKANTRTWEMGDVASPRFDRRELEATHARQLRDVIRNLNDSPHLIDPDYEAKAAARLAARSFPQPGTSTPATSPAPKAAKPGPRIITFELDR